MNKKLIIIIGFTVLIAMMMLVVHFTKSKPTNQYVKKIKPVTLKKYQNDLYGIEFMYNQEWSISEFGHGNIDGSEPLLLIRAGTTSDELCEDLGCPPRSGDRDIFTKRYTFEGAPPLNPFYKILHVRGNKWVSIQVTDVKINCPSKSFCDNYISNAPLEKKAKIDDSKYQTYNEFIDLLSTFKMIK